MNSLPTREQCDRADGARREREWELRQLIDAVPQQVFVPGQTGSPLRTNQAVLAFTGLTLEDAQPEDYVAEVFHPDDLERVRGPQ